jgi:hypothetical protein
MFLNLQRWLIMAITSFSGATAVIASTMILLGRIDLADLGINPVRAVIDDSIFWSLAWLVVGIIGFMVQATESEYVLEPPPTRRAW